MTVNTFTFQTMLRMLQTGCISGGTAVFMTLQEEKTKTTNQTNETKQKHFQHWCQLILILRQLEPQILIGPCCLQMTNSCLPSNDFILLSDFFWGEAGFCHMQTQ